MALSSFCKTTRRSRVLLTGALLALLLAAACEAPSGDAPAAAAGDGSDAGVSAAPGDHRAADASSTSDASAPSARDVELARMQAHLDSLYSQNDVVHRFTTAWGDPVDCVPFAKQPGFSLVGTMNGAAPVLAAVRGLDSAAAIAGFGDGVDADGHARSCPSGAVPIRRLTIQDLARFATLEEFFSKAPLHGGSGVVDADGNIHEHAYYTESSIPNWGAQVTINVWNPAIEVDDNSISQLWVTGGLDGQLQTLEAGYVAHKKYFGDPSSRLFIYSTADAYAGKTQPQCWDLGCKAFVQLADTHILLGGKFDKASTLHGEQREFKLRWQFCPQTECLGWEGWWLHYDGGSTSEWVGFYPRSRYASPGARDGADRLDFGGEVAFTRGSAHTTTDMGSGQPASAGFGGAAYQTDLLRITPAHAWAGIGEIVQGDEVPNCYASGPLTTFTGPPTSVTPLPKQTFYFGGTGRSTVCK